ncbi:MAG: hypothetical protein IKW30_10645 [Lachnospiraceae bacterium]|nr:hypothetical protein [Lachnospiraceae bacterium]
MKAKDTGVKYEVLVQYDGLESNLSEIYERVKRTYIESGHDIESFKEIKLYIKPQDFTAYYVINGDYTGKVGLF